MLLKRKSQEQTQKSPIQRFLFVLDVLCFGYDDNILEGNSVNPNIQWKAGYGNTADSVCFLQVHQVITKQINNETHI